MNNWEKSRAQEIYQEEVYVQLAAGVISIASVGILYLLLIYFALQNWF